VLVELVEDDRGCCVALEIDDDADALTIALIRAYASAIASTIREVVTWNGTSVITILLRPFSSMISALPRIMTEPRPVRYAVRMI